MSETEACDVCRDKTPPRAGAKCKACGFCPVPLPAHHCHARGCTISTTPEMLMCFKHWRMVPKHIQRQVWATYRSGQCDDKRPSRDWHAAADAAINAVADKEAPR